MKQAGENSARGLGCWLYLKKGNYNQYNQTPYTLTSVYTFSILFSIHFLWYLQREFVQQSRASLVGDHFLYSHDLNVCFRGDTDGRK